MTANAVIDMIKYLYNKYLGNIMLLIKKAVVLHDKVLDLEFEQYNGHYQVDMQDYINNNHKFKLINELNSNDKFADYVIDNGAIIWANGFDIAPEYLFYLANKDNTQYIELFKEWGYAK